MKLASAMFLATAIFTSIAFAQPATLKPSTGEPQSTMFLSHSPLPPESLIEVPWQCQIEQRPGDATWAPNLWPGGVVPFEFAPNVTAANQSVAMNAMNAWASASNLVFRAATAGDPGRIRFESRTDCGAGTSCGTSPVGFLPGTLIIRIGNCPPNPQPCTGNETWTFRVTTHEVGHALGRFHEHQRHDRDTHVAIHQQNYSGPQFLVDFGIAPPGAGYWGPFDFDSIMMYRACTFSACSSCNCADPNCFVIEALPPNQAHQCTMGSATTLSPVDRLSTRGLYPFPSDRWLRIGGLPGNPGSFIQPYGATPVAYAGTPTGGTLFVDPGIHPGSTGTYSRPLTIRGTYGTATLGN